MRHGGQTTVIQRILERRAQKPPEIQEDTSDTIAVMLRVLPPPRALLVLEDPSVRRIEALMSADLFATRHARDESSALELMGPEFFPVVITDSHELIRRIRACQTERKSYIIFVAELDESNERESGLLAGADDCVGRRAGEQELLARIGAARRIAELEAVLRIALVENRKLSTTDDLTRVASRRFFSKHLPREVDRAARYGRALSLILCDIDHFKNINDTLGHAGGDEVLRQFGARLQQALRRGIDWVARIGGEEFAIVLPETSYDKALDVARKLRAGVANTSFEVQGRKLEITASFGLCGLESVPAGMRRITENLVKIADAALYRSKNSGRNRVTATLFPSSPPAPKRAR